MYTIRLLTIVWCYFFFQNIAMWAAGLYSAKSSVRSLCEYMGAARDALSMGTIEIKLGDIPEGKSVTFTWRGKPLFVRHRVDSEISKETAVPLSELRDPQTDAVCCFCYYNSITFDI